MSTDWESVYRSSYRDVVGFLSGMLMDHDRARDMAQEAFARVLGRDAENPRGLVFRTAANLARDEARLVVRRRKHLSLLKSDEEALGARPPKPDAELEARERAQRARDALAELSETDRQVLILWNAGFDYNEIAEQTGLSKGALGTTIARAKKKFRDACTAEDSKKDAQEGTDASHG